MNSFERSLTLLLARELEKKQPVFQVMTGPRQVGKTTIAYQVMEKLPFPSVYASADTPLPPGPEWIETQWRRAEIDAARSGGAVLLVLDEVQKVRGWSESLKGHVGCRHPEITRYPVACAGIIRPADSGGTVGKPGGALFPASVRPLDVSGMRGRLWLGPDAVALFRRISRRGGFQ